MEQPGTPWRKELYIDFADGKSRRNARRPKPSSSISSLKIMSSPSWLKTFWALSKAILIGTIRRSTEDDFTKIELVIPESACSGLFWTVTQHAGHKDGGKNSAWGSTSSDMPKMSVPTEKYTPRTYLLSRIRPCAESAPASACPSWQSIFDSDSYFFSGAELNLLWFSSTWTPSLIENKNLRCCLLSPEQTITKRRLHQQFPVLGSVQVQRKHA